MYDTKNINSEFVGISIERVGMKRKLESGLIGERLQSIFEDKDVLSYFNDNLVQKVRTWSSEFLTQNGKDYFNFATQRDNLFENFKINLETNLLGNAVSFWCKLSGEASLEIVMLRLLDVNFAKRVIDILAKAFEELRDKIKDEEINGLINGTSTFIAEE